MHPIRQFLTQSIKIFEELGFEVAEGPEVETEWYNFDSLRIFENHPARDVQDTFWLKNCKVLRTHTSAMQVKIMETKKPPVRILVPGRVFRHESINSNHEANFYQLEGFAIDKNITMSNLIGTLDYFIKKTYGQDIKIRFRPSYFPFTEPSMEVDIKWSGTQKWEEVMGAGMIHKGVLGNMRLNSDQWQGFAFGMGMDRLMMLKNNIKDIRLSYSGDLRFLKQFK